MAPSLTSLSDPCDTADMPLVKTGFGIIYLVLFSIFALFGATITLVGAILPRIFSDFGWSYVEAGTVLAAGAVGTFVATFFAGRFLHHLGVRLLLILGVVLEIGGLSLFGSNPSVAFNVILYMIIGIGQGCLEVGVNWSVVHMVNPGDGRAMNLVHGAFSIGAVVGPLLTAAVLSSGLGWEITLKLVALVFVPVAIGLFILPLGRLGREERNKAAHFRELAANPALWLGFGLLLLYVGAEMGISNWSAEYFVKTFHSTPEIGALTVSLFWLGLMVGRIGFPFLLPHTRSDRLLVGLSVLFSVSTGALFGAGTAGPVAAPLAFGAVILAGLGASCIYPSGITLVGASFRQGQATALGLASTGGGIGAFAFPYAMSAIAGSAGLLSGFAFYAGLSLLVAAAGAALASVTRRSLS